MGLQLIFCVETNKKCKSDQKIVPYSKVLRSKSK